MKKILFHIKAYAYLAEKMLACSDLERGEVEVNTFTDGERYQRILSEVENRDIILLGGTVNDEATLELFDLASSLVSYGANYLTLIVPYFGYSTMERAVLSQEIVTAKTRASAVVFGLC
jgi:ribose-phosphate pyrophosphokinase